jgi:hypothetical protein
MVGVRVLAVVAALAGFAVLLERGLCSRGCGVGFRRENLLGEDF